MSEIFSNFHFLRPWWLLALAALPLLWRVFAGGGGDAGAWRGAVDAHLLRHLLVGSGDAPPSRWPRRLALAAWALAAFALAGPAWERLPQPLYQNRAARVFALELAPSMLAQDVSPSRYERARYKLADMLKRSGDAQTALIAYAGDAFVVAPLTDDANTVANLVDALDPHVMPVTGNATSRAIDLGVKLVKQAGVPDAEIVLLADSVDDAATGAARRAHAAGVRVSVLGIGTEHGAPVVLQQGGFLRKDADGNILMPKLDTAGLASVAASGGGRYVTYTADANDLDRLLEPLAAAPDASAQTQTLAQTARFLDRGPWFVLLLLPLAALAFRRGWLLVLPFAMLHVGTAHAFSWQDLWLRSDQQARAELDAGNAKQAQALAESPELRASAAYRAGDFASAARDFASADTADAQYDLGNALAKQGRYEEAIAAYDAALKRAPDLADARANKQAVEDWLKRQRDQKSSQQQQKSGAQDHQGHEQSQSGSGSSEGEKNEQQNADQNGQGDQGQQQSGQGQDGQQGKKQPQNGSDGSHDDANASSQNGDRQQASKSAGDANDDATRQTAAQQNAARAEDKQAEQAFGQSMDRALRERAQDKQQAQQPVRLGAVDDGREHDEHRQAIDQWLERVPDDPGGLLRRKFQLEYERRRQGRDSTGEGG